MIAAIGRYLQSMFMVIMGLFKRAMCFLNRKRRDSGSILPTHVKDSEVINMELPQQVMPPVYEAPPPRELPVMTAVNNQVSLLKTNYNYDFIISNLHVCFFYTTSTASKTCKQQQ